MDGRMDRRTTIILIIIMIYMYIYIYIYIYIYTPLPVSRVFGAHSGSPQISCLVYTVIIVPFFFSSSFFNLREWPGRESSLQSCLSFTYYYVKERQIPIGVECIAKLSQPAVLLLPS